MLADPAKDEGDLDVGGIDYQILATDYDNYALVYCCSPISKFASAE